MAVNLLRGVLIKRDLSMITNHNFQKKMSHFLKLTEQLKT